MPISMAGMNKYGLRVMSSVKIVATEDRRTAGQQDKQDKLHRSIRYLF